MSGEKKSQGTTSRLLLTAKEVLKPKQSDTMFRTIVEELHREHSDAATKAIRDAALRDHALGAIQEEFRRLQSFLEAAHVSDALTWTLNAVAYWMR